MPAMVLTRSVIMAGVLLTAVASAAASPGATAPGAPPAAPSKPEAPTSLAVPGTVVEAILDRGITNATRDYLIDALHHAESVAATALVIRMDTPGGLLSATHDIVAAELASPIPVIVYVAPPGARAGSAGVFITLAANIAAMAPGTHIGAAHPVGIFGGDIKGEMARKVENDAAAWARSIAEVRHRNVEWAAKAVRKSAAITATQALAQNVVNLIAANRTALLTKLDGRKVTVAGATRILHTAGARVVSYTMSGREKLVSWLADPDLIYLFMLGGLFLLFLEFKHPGLIVPGIVGGLLLVLVLGVQVLPVNWVAVILILGAVAFFIAEIYVTSFGLLTIAGIICLVLGAYMLFDVPGSSFRVDPVIIWTVALTFAALVLGIGMMLLRAQRQGGTSGVDGMVGETGLVSRDILPGQPGKVQLRGAYWTATADRALQKGMRVRVVRMEAGHAHVVPVESDAKQTVDSMGPSGDQRSES